MKSFTAKPITIDGVRYPSQSAAARALCVTERSIAHRVQRAKARQKQESSTPVGALTWEFLYDQLR